MVAPSFSGDLPRSLFINVFGTVESEREAGRKEGREGYLPFLTDVGESFETLCRPTRLHFSPWPIHRERERYIGLVMSCSSVGVYREG